MKHGGKEEAEDEQFCSRAKTKNFTGETRGKPDQCRVDIGQETWRVTSIEETPCGRMYVRSILGMFRVALARLQRTRTRST